MTGPRWFERDDRACRDVDTALFFPDGRHPDRHNAAQSVCRRCPVVRPCLRYALVVDVAGVWGATTLAERVALRIEHGLNATAADSLAAADLTLGGTCT